MIAMNKNQLSKYYRLSLEIKDLEERIAEVEGTLVGSSKITGMPRGSGISDPVTKTAELLVTLKKRLEKRKVEAMDRLLQIEEYVSSIEDVEVRLIFTKRYIEFKKWPQIAEELFMSERSVHRKHSDYLGRNNNDRKH